MGVVAGAEHMVGVIECAIDVTKAKAETPGKIVLHGAMNHWRIGFQGIHAMCCCRQGLPIDNHLLGCVFGTVTGISDDHGHRFANETDFLAGQGHLSHWIADCRIRYLQQNAFLAHFRR